MLLPSSRSRISASAATNFKLAVAMVLNSLHMVLLANSIPLRTSINPFLVPEFGVIAGVNPDGAG